MTRRRFDIFPALLLIFLAILVSAMTFATAAQDGGAGPAGAGSIEDQDAGDGDQSEPSPETKPSPEEVWGVEAEAVLARVDLSEDMEKRIADLFITKRREDLNARAEARAEHLAWRAEQMEQLQENNLISAGFLDESNLQRTMDMIRKNKQKELAEELVALVEKPMAEKLWPYFGAFDQQVDLMVEYFMTDGVAPASEADSEEERVKKRESLLAAALLVQDYAIALEQAKWSRNVRYIGADGREHIDRRVYNWYVDRFRDQLIGALNRHLESGRVESFVKRFRLRGK